MIKRIVGLLAAAAVLAVVVFAILGSGTYSSFIGRAGRSAAAPAATSVAAPDSTSDSLVNAPEDTTAARNSCGYGSGFRHGRHALRREISPCHRADPPVDRTDQAEAAATFSVAAAFLPPMRLTCVPVRSADRR